MLLSLPMLLQKFAAENWAISCSKAFSDEGPTILRTYSKIFLAHCSSSYLLGASLYRAECVSMRITAHDCIFCQHLTQFAYNSTDGTVPARY